MKKILQAGCHQWRIFQKDRSARSLPFRRLRSAIAHSCFLTKMKLQTFSHTLMYVFTFFILLPFLVLQESKLIRSMYVYYHMR